MSQKLPLEIMDDLRLLAIAAGNEIMQVYESEFDVEHKDDRSPVTEADLAAERVILEGLRKLAPDIPAVAEERVAAGEVPDISGGLFWLVDPLDGTREFVRRETDFTVNIGLIAEGHPILGVVYAPAKGRIFYGAEPSSARTQDRLAGDGWSEPRPIRVRPPSADRLIVVASKSHRNKETDDYLAGLPVADIASAGSSLKFCLVAAGEADLYPRLGRTMEWDTAAGHAVLRAAGGRVDRLDDGTPLSYGKPGFENPFFAATSGIRAPRLDETHPSS